MLRLPNIAITALRLSLCEPLSDVVEPEGWTAALPRFLQNFPLLNRLDIKFPREEFSERSMRAVLSSLSGNKGFDSLRSLRFPSLKELSLSNVRLRDSFPLREFFGSHASTPRIVSFVNLALARDEWLPFLEFVAASMKLDDIAINLDLVDEDEVRYLEGVCSIKVPPVLVRSLAKSVETRRIRLF